MLTCQTVNCSVSSSLNSCWSAAVCSELGHLRNNIANLRHGWSGKKRVPETCEWLLVLEWPHSKHFTTTTMKLSLMPGPGPTLTQLAQNVGEGVRASENQLKKLDQINPFLSSKLWKFVTWLNSKLETHCWMLVGFFWPKPFNFGMSFLDLRAGSLALEPLVNLPQNAADGQPSTELDGANDAGSRPETDPAPPVDPPEPRATRRRRVLNLAEGQSVGIARNAVGKSEILSCLLMCWNL